MPTPTPSSPSPARAWSIALGAAVALGVLAALTNVTSVEQLSGQHQEWAAFRRTVSRLVNAGVVWAGLAVLAGWLVRRPVSAALAGAASLLVAVLVHYGVGSLAGLMPWATLGSNTTWVVSALVLGLPLGLVGALARHPGPWGLAARLLLPVGALLEPFVVGLLPPSTWDTWAGRVSGTTAGALLLVGGTVAAVLVVRRWRAARRAPTPA